MTMDLSHIISSSNQVFATAELLDKSSVTSTPGLSELLPWLQGKLKFLKNE